MTDNLDPPDLPRLSVSDDVRAEVARAGQTSAGVRMQLEGMGIKISRTTWAERMNDPSGWRVGELVGIANALALSVEIRWSKSTQDRE